LRGARDQFRVMAMLIDSGIFNPPNSDE
jgi:hypothetical protein